MSVKRFLGLGDVLEPALKRPVLGTVNVPSVRQDSRDVVTHDELAPPRGRVSNLSAPSADALRQQVVKPETRVLSRTSSPASYETVSHDLNFEATPHYNFWTSDETTSDGEPRGNRSLDDVPRYVRLTWDQAPDLASLFSVSDKSYRKIDGVKFGVERMVGRSATSRGISFAPDHLQPGKFGTVVTSLANGFLSPGTIHSVVELVPPPVGRPPVSDVDEDAFLTHPSTRGLAVHEIRASLEQVARSTDRRPTSGMRVTGMSRLGGRPSLEVADTNSSPSLSLVTATAQSRQVSQVDHLVELAYQVSRQDDVMQSRDPVTVRVSFVDPAVTGLVSRRKVGGVRRPEHAENVIALASFLPNLEVLSQSGFSSLSRKDDVPSFASPAGVPRLEYVGYVIEKYGRTDAGAFELIREIHVPDRATSEYYDCEIRYGRVYRYRLRAVLRWTRPTDVGVSGRSELVAGEHGSQTAPVMPQLSSYLGGEWSAPWRYATCVDTVPPPPPDELTVRPNSRRRHVTVTMRLPDDSQRDIWTLRLYRRLRDASGRDVSGWEQVGGDFGPRNVLYEDTDVRTVGSRPDPSVVYVYAALSISRHGEVSYLSEQLGTRLNPEYAVRGEFPVELVSCAGARLGYVGAFSTVPFRATTSDVVARVPRALGDGSNRRATLTLSGRDGSGRVAADDARYVLRVQSLDTGETRDVPVHVTYNNVNERVERLSTHSSVRNARRPLPAGTVERNLNRER